MRNAPVEAVQSERDSAWVAVFIFSVAGLLLLLAITRWGVGLDFDAVAYIGRARDLLIGRGYTTAHWPPLVSTVLAAISLLGIDPLIGARWLNAALFGANIALAGALVTRYSGGFLWATLLATFLMFASEDMLVIHSMAWSEPLFIFLGILGISLLAEYVDRGRVTLLIVSSVAIACAFLTRYVGASFVLAGTMGLLTLNGRPWGRRLVEAGTFVALAALPAFLWMIRNVLTVGSATDRVVAVHAVGSQNLIIGLLTIAAWFLPKRLPAFLSLALTASVAIVGALAWYRDCRRQDDRSRRRQRVTLPILLGIFIVSYSLVLITAISFLDLAVLDKRTLSPVFVAGLVLVLCAIGARRQSGQISKIVRVCAVLLGIYLAGLHGFRGAQYALHAYHEGLGYSSQTWRESPTIRKIAELPTGLYIYSNYPDAVYVLTGRMALSFPRKTDNVSGLRNQAYSRQLTEVRERLGQGRAVVALFTTARHDSYETELEKDLSLVLAEETRDGGIYRYKSAQIPGL